MITAAILGAGSRGAEGYGRYSEKRPDLLKIVSICDINKERVEKYSKIFHVEKNKCFYSDEEMLSQEKLADVMFICTQDRDHYKHAMMALDKGYHILLEKPISPVLSECNAIVKKAKEKNCIIVVGHVARYMMYFQKIKELIDSKIIGDLVAINQIENVEFWHQAHSFVRGNWRNSNETSPMILQKCCHDMDLLYWMIGSECKWISSMGNLNYFTSKNAPEGCAKRCLDGCKVKKECPYDAEKIYIDNFVNLNITDEEKLNRWPYCQVIVDPTVDRLYDAIKTGPYGRCVFHSDNNVVDHQIVNMVFENGVTANLTMSAFTHSGGRQVKVMGTLGDIVADECLNTITVGVYGKPKQVIDVRTLTDDFSGHGGGDNRLMADFLEAFEKKMVKSQCLTNIENSVESHYMALAAEKSRLETGRLINLDEYKKTTCANEGEDECESC